MVDKKIGLKRVRKNLKRAFQVLTLLGAIVTMTLFASISSDTTDYLVFIPLLPMIIYILYGYQQPNIYKQMNDFSDSVYYMGFIFTLVSLLSVVLFKKVSNEPTMLLNYFGMALSTTIAGILFRSFHHQFTNLSYDPVAQARKELGEEVDNFKESVEEMSRRIETFSEALVSTLPNKLNESVNKFDEKFNLASNILNNNMDELVSSTEQISRKTKQSFSNLHNSIDTSNQNILAMVEDIENVSNESIQNLSNSSQKVLRELSKIQEYVTNYSNQLASNSESNLLKVTLDSLESANKDFITLSDRIKQTASSWDSTNDAFENASKTLRKEIKKIQEMFKEMGNLIEHKIK